jgi:hypothetical protein
LGSFRRGAGLDRRSWVRSVARLGSFRRQDGLDPEQEWVRSGAKLGSFRRRRPRMGSNPGQIELVPSRNWVRSVTGSGIIPRIGFVPRRVVPGRWPPGGRMFGRPVSTGSMTGRSPGGATRPDPRDPVADRSWIPSWKSAAPNTLSGRIRLEARRGRRGRGRCQGRWDARKVESARAIIRPPGMIPARKSDRCSLWSASRELLR